MESENAARWLEPISKSLEEDNEASKLNKAQEIFGIELPSDKNAPLPPYPGEKRFNEPAPFGTASTCDDLGWKVCCG
jgi:hypothetical protein